MGIGLALMVAAGIGGCCFVAYLFFMVFVIVKTGDTKGLRDVAVAMRAYRSPLPKMPSLRRKPPE